MEIHGTYIPHQKQIEAHCAAEQFIGYGGAMGGGKTRWLCEMAKFLSLKFPGNFGVIARQSGPVLENTTMEVFFSEVLIPGSEEWKQLGCVFQKDLRMLSFEALSPPSKLWFTGLDKDNTEKVKSLNLGFFAIDEATEVSENIFLMFMTRLRRAHIPKIYRKGIISANPEAGWVKRRFVDQQLANHKFVFALPKDNPHLPEDYAELFDSMPTRWRSKYLEGSWDAASGLVYKEFDRKIHVIPDQSLPKFWKRIRGLDHGQQNPTAVVGIALAQETPEDLIPFIGEERLAYIHPDYQHYPYLFVERLYYSPGLVVEHKERIAKVFKDYASKGTYCDPSIRRKDRQKMIVDSKGAQKFVEHSIFDEYLELPYPITDLVVGNNDVRVGIDRISTLLMIGHVFFLDNQSLLPLIGETGELLNYEWEETKDMNEAWPEEPKKTNEHALDAFRYAVMSLEKPAPKGKIVPWNSFEEVRKRAQSWKKEKERASVKGFQISRGRARTLR